MRNSARFLTLTAALAFALSACDQTPAPTPGPALTPPPATAAPTAAATPVITPSPSPTPLATGSIPWVYLQTVVKPDNNVDYYALYMGFAGKSATAALRFKNKVEKYQVDGDLLLVGNTVYKIADATILFDGSKQKPPLPTDVANLRLDARGDKWLFYEISPTLSPKGDEIGGFEWHRLNLTTGEDVMLLAFGRPFGAPWADRDHSHYMMTDLNKPGVIHYVVCANGIDKADCTFYVAGPTDDKAAKQVAVSGNTKALCRILGVDDHYAFTAEPAEGCPATTKPTDNDSVKVRVTDLTTGQSKAIVFNKGKQIALHRPQLVATSEGPRLIYIIKPQGAKARELDAYDPAQDIIKRVAFAIDVGSTISPSQYLVLEPPRVVSTLSGRVLLSPADVKTLNPVAAILWSPDGPQPVLVDVLLGTSTPTKIWDLPEGLEIKNP